MSHAPTNSSWKQTWANYWLLICGSILVVGSVALVWLKFPYSFNVGGWELPIQNIVPHIHEFSYGFSGIAVLAIAFFLRKRFRWSLLLGAAILLTFWLLVPGRISFHQAPLLRRLSEEHEAVPEMKAFTRSFIPQNHEGTERIRKHLDVVTLPGRTAASCAILGIGWYLFGLGSLLVAAYAISRLPGQRVRATLILILLPAGVLGAVGMQSMMGHYYYHRASLARAAGNTEQALANYRKAIKWDGFYTSGIEVFNAIGQLETQAGIEEGSAARSVSRAMDLKAQHQYESSLAELQTAAKKSPVIAKAARHEASRIRAEWGMARYQAGAVEEAVANWKQALAEDTGGRPLKSQPSLLYVLPYIARADCQLGHYEAGLKAATDWAEVVGDHSSLQADAYSMAADCSAKLGRDADARRYQTLYRALAGM